MARFAKLAVNLINQIMKIKARGYARKMKKYNCPPVGECKPCKEWGKKPVIDIYKTAIEKSCDKCCFETWKPKRIKLPVATEKFMKDPKKRMQNLKPKLCKPGMKMDKTAEESCSKVKDYATQCFKSCQGLKIAKCPKKNPPLSKEHPFHLYKYFNCKGDGIPLPDWDHWAS